MLKNKSIVIAVAGICLLGCLALALEIQMHLDWTYILITVVSILFVAAYLLVIARLAHSRRKAPPSFPWSKFWIIFALGVTYGISQLSKADWEQTYGISFILVIIFALYMLWLQMRMRKRKTQ